MDDILAQRYFDKLCQWHDRWIPREIHKLQWIKALLRMSEMEAQRALNLYYETREAKFETPSYHIFLEIERKVCYRPSAEQAPITYQYASFTMVCIGPEEKERGDWGQMATYEYPLAEKGDMDWERILAQYQQRMHRRYGGSWVMYHNIHDARAKSKELRGIHGWPPKPGTTERRFETVGVKSELEKQNIEPGNTPESLQWTKDEHARQTLQLQQAVLTEEVDGRRRQATEDAELPVDEGFEPAEEIPDGFNPNRLMKDDSIPF